MVALAEKLNADVYAEPIASRWAFPRSHRLLRGGLLPARKPLADQLAGYDTVVVLGAPVFLYYAFVPGNAIAPGTKLFQITNSPQDASTALAGASIVGNLKAAAEYLRSRVKPVERTVPARTEPPEPSHRKSHNLRVSFLYAEQAHAARRDYFRGVPVVER